MSQRREAQAHRGGHSGVTDVGAGSDRQKGSRTQVGRRPGAEAEGIQDEQGGS